ncbi:hypothetical protein ACH4SP_11780 [Streptomyces sp. NPDC021093]|uniref:hypothetical protein n=1 Tax=Streptomyces sp. NPDC021093 TaxID=3365112 RepID=UPI00379CBA85
MTSRFTVRLGGGHSRWDGVLPSTVARIVAPAPTALVSYHPQLIVTCLVTDQAQLRELTLGTVDVVLGQRYHHLPDTAPRGIGDLAAARRHLDRPSRRAAHRPAGTGHAQPRRAAADHGPRTADSGQRTADSGQAILHACHQVGFTPTTRYITADITAQLAFAIVLVPRAAIDPATPGIRTAPIEDRSILRLLFVATRRTETANPTTTAVIAALRTAARQGRTTHFPAV